MRKTHPTPPAGDQDVPGRECTLARRQALFAWDKLCAVYMGQVFIKTDEREGHARLRP